MCKNKLKKAMFSVLLLFFINSNIYCVEKNLETKKENSTKIDISEKIKEFLKKEENIELENKETITESIKEFLKITGLISGSTILYGILHDQVTVRICREYFTTNAVPHHKLVTDQYIMENASSTTRFFLGIHINFLVWITTRTFYFLCRYYW
jgi:hypothetical protein